MKRSLRIDCLRVFACIMVLFCHAPQPYNGQPGQFLMGVDTFYGMAWGPMLFFMISGACILWEPREAMPFLKKRFSRVLVPTVLWSIIYIFMECFIWHSASQGSFFTKALGILVAPQFEHLWFMYALIAIYLVAPIFSRWLNVASKKEILTYLCLWGIVLLIPYIELTGADMSPLKQAAGLLFYMFGYIWYATLGYYCRKHVIIKKAKWWHLLLSIAIIISPIYLYIIKYFTGESVNSSFSLLPALTTLLLFVAFMNIPVPSKIKNSDRIKAGITKLSQLSLGIYLCHMIFMRPVRLFFTEHSIHYAIQIPLTVLIVGLCSFLLSWGVSKIPYSKYLIG